VEGLLGRVLGDFMIHYVNLVGAYILCATVLAVALYLSTAFSFSSLRTWAPTRFAFVTALWNRYQDWRQERAKRRQQKELDKRRISKPIVKTQLIQSRPTSAAQPSATTEARRTGIERMMAEERGNTAEPATATGGILAESFAADTSINGVTAELADPEVMDRADSGHHAKTTMPRIAGGYKLPSSSLLQRPDEQQHREDQPPFHSTLCSSSLCRAYRKLTTSSAAPRPENETMRPSASRFQTSTVTTRPTQSKESSRPNQR